MRLCAFVVMLWAVLAAGTAADPMGALATRLPGDMEDMSSWESYAGDVHDAEMDVRFHLYVNPRLPALYQVMHYRVRSVRIDGAPTAVEERLVWNRAPGRHAQRCFAYEAAAPPVGETWREIVPGSDEYRAEMRRLMHLLLLRRERTTRETP